MASIDFDNELILVTAASGKQAANLIPHLVKKWKHLRLAVRSPSSKETLSSKYPDAEVVQADLSDQKACRDLLKGVTACFLITPAFTSHETICGINMIDAARENVKSGGPFKHFVHSSVLHPIIRPMANHDSKRQIEEYLVSSSLQYTILQPTHMMEMLPLAKLAKEDKPMHTMPWNPSTKFCFVSAVDVGEAAARVFEGREKHFYATYEIVGTAVPQDYHDVLKIVSQAIGKEVRVEKKPLEEMAAMIAGVMAKDADEDVRREVKQGFARMFLHYDEHGLLGNPNVLRMLLGREPLDWEAYVKRTLESSS